MFEDLLTTESSWEFLKNTPLPIVVYGTGNGADMVFDEFERLDIKCSEQTDEKRRLVTGADFYDFGLSGKEGSAQKRKILLGALGLPEYLSQRSLLEYINSTMEYCEFIEKVNEILC